MRASRYFLNSKSLLYKRAYLWYTQAVNIFTCFCICEVENGDRMEIKMDGKIREGFLIRELGVGDEGLIDEFFDAMGGESRALFNRRDYNRRGALKYCTNRDKTRRYYAFLSDGRMAGYVFFLDFHTAVPELGLALRDDLTGRGLGGELMRFAIDVAKNAGAGGIILTTHTANIRAQALYEKFGFICLGLTKNSTELFYLLRFKNEKDGVN